MMTLLRQSNSLRIRKSGFKALFAVLFLLITGFSASAQLYTQYFSGSSLPANWVTAKLGMGNNWTVAADNNYAGTGSTGTSSMRYSFNGSAANAYAFLQGINLTAGKAYNIEFYQKVGNASFSENLQVSVGTAQTITSLSTNLLILNNLTNTTYTHRTTNNFIPATTGTYYFAFACLSGANRRQLYIDYIKVIEEPPVITVIGTPLSTFYSSGSVTSMQQSYTLSGDYVNNTISIVPPAGFEVSLTGGSAFNAQNPLVINAVNSTINDTTIYVRSNSPGSSLFSGNIAHTSGTTSVNVAVSGNNAPCTPTTKVLNLVSSITSWLGLPWTGGAPTPCDNAIINLSALETWASETVTLNLTAPVSVNNLTINASSSGLFGHTIQIQTNGYPLLIKGNLIIQSTDGTLTSSRVILKGSGNSDITVMGNLVMTGNSGSFWGIEYGNTVEIQGSGAPLDIKVLGNVTVNKYASFTNANLILDAAGSQSITNNSDSLVILNNITIGESNSPSVSLSGSVIANAKKLLINGGNLTLNNNSILTLAAGTSIGQATASTGSLIMNDASVLKLTDNTSTFINGTTTYTGVNGSNFPARFANYVLSSASTVEYNGAAQNINAVTYGNLTLSNTGIKTAPPVLTINGDFTNNGATFNHNNGLVQMTGSGAQRFAGVGYNSLALSGGNTKTTNGNLSIIDSLKIFSGTGLALKSSDTITLSSTLLKTASFAKMESGAVVTYGANAAFIVERYIPNHTKAWQLLAAPSKGQTIKSAWQEGALTANGNPKPGYGAVISSNLPNAVAGLGFDSYTPAGSTIKIYQPATGTWISPASTSASISNVEGYMVLVRGDRSVTAYNQAATATTMRTTGKLYTNGADAPAVATVQAGKFASVANPYAAAINFSKLSRTGDIQDVFYLWDPKLTGSYGMGAFQTFISNNNGTYFTVMPGGSYSGGNTNIESGLAFFVKSPANGGTIAFSEDAKTQGSNLVTRPGGPVDQLRIHLNVINNNAPLTVDAALLQFEPTYSNTIDENDVRKLGNSAENLSIVSNATDLTAERRASIMPTDTIFLKLTGLGFHDYSFDIIGQDLGAPFLEASLEDTYLNTKSVIDLDNTTAVNFSVTADAGSYAPNRFRIVFKNTAVILPVTFTTISATRVNEKQVNIKWTSENEYNMDSYTIERSGNGVQFSEAGTMQPEANNHGAFTYSFMDMNATADAYFYRVSGNSTSGLKQYTAIVKVAAVKGVVEMTVYPNPVTGKTLQLHYSMMPAGNYSLVLVNRLGQEVFKNVVKLDGSGATSVQLNNAISSGTYSLRITNGDKAYQQVIMVL